MKLFSLESFCSFQPTFQSFNWNQFFATKARNLKKATSANFFLQPLLWNKIVANFFSLVKIPRRSFFLWETNNKLFLFNEEKSIFVVLVAKQLTATREKIIEILKFWKWSSLKWMWLEGWYYTVDTKQQLTSRAFLQFWFEMERK